eukprot:COSAG06_NODE_3283_length_5558_cov_2.577761_7_plen_131_part_00
MGNNILASRALGCIQFTIRLYWQFDGNLYKDPFCPASCQTLKAFTSPYTRRSRSETTIALTGRLEVTFSVCRGSQSTGVGKMPEQRPSGIFFLLHDSAAPRPKLVSDSNVHNGRESVSTQLRDREVSFAL